MAAAIPGKKLDWNDAVQVCGSAWYSADQGKPTFKPFPRELVALIMARLTPAERTNYSLNLEERCPLIPLSPYQRDILFNAPIPRSMAEIEFFDRLALSNTAMLSGREKLDLRVTEFVLPRDATDETLRDITTRFPNLRSLDLSDSNRISNTGLAHLRVLLLQTLNLNGLRITDAGLACLKELPLQSLDLSFCRNITDAGLAHLEGLPLQKLYLGLCSKITNAGLAYLKSPLLKELDFTYCNKITDTGLAHLSGLPLQSLNLYQCSAITDEGLAHLSGLPLQSLDLSFCSKITDAGLAHLGGLPLQKLCLGRCCNITDAGLAYLGTPPLKELDLRYCNITDAGLALLRNRPGLYILRGELSNPNGGVF